MFGRAISGRGYYEDARTMFVIYAICPHPFCPAAKRYGHSPSMENGIRRLPVRETGSREENRRLRTPPSARQRFNAAHATAAARTRMRRESGGGRRKAEEGVEWR